MTAHTTIDTATRPPRSTGRRVLTLLGALLATIGAVILTAIPANAATFNPMLSRDVPWGNCTIRVGVVPDSAGAAQGGVTTWCSGRHAWTSATVWLKFNGGPVAGSARSTTYYNSYGFNGNILTTNRFCGAGYWQVVANVSTAEYGTIQVTNGAPVYYKAC
jgi:hypothetical protein